MSASAKLRNQFRPPIITCPSCGDHMRLSTIVPEKYHCERMTLCVNVVSIIDNLAR
jgi:hypothetical protein